MCALTAVSDGGAEELAQVLLLSGIGVHGTGGNGSRSGGRRRAAVLRVRLQWTIQTAPSGSDFSRQILIRGGARMRTEHSRYEWH